MENTLNWPVLNIPKVTRETKRDGSSLKLRCVRDFFFFTLAFYGHTFDHPQELESRLFGLKVPVWLIFTMFHVKNMPRLFVNYGLQLYINNRPVSSWTQMLWQLAIPRNVSWETVKSEVTAGLRDNYAVGIDISLGWWGLFDHVMFVYSEDEAHYYVLDTQKLPYLCYTQVHDELFLMKLSKSEVRNRIKPYSRLWKVVPREIG